MQQDTAIIDDFPGYTFYRNGRVTNRLGQYIGYLHKSGYIQSQFINKASKRVSKYLHQMIILAFSGENANGRDVDHINNIKTDNRYENLQYLDRKSHCKKTRESNPHILKNNTYPVQGIDLNGNIKNFNSIKEAYEFLNPKINIEFIYDRICKSIKNNTIYEGYRWKYLNTESLPGEIWKTPNIDGLQSNIEVSNMSRTKFKNGIIKSEFKVIAKYVHVYVKINDKDTRRGLHTLVCSAFHGKQPEWATSVNHIDGNPVNNRAENLEWSDASKQNKCNCIKVDIIKDGITTIFNSMKETAIFLKISVVLVNYYLENGKLINGYKLIREEPKKIKN